MWYVCVCFYSCFTIVLNIVVFCFLFIFEIIITLTRTWKGKGLIFATVVSCPDYEDIDFQGYIMKVQDEWLRKDTRSEEFLSEFAILKLCEVWSVST